MKNSGSNRSSRQPQRSNDYEASRFDRERSSYGRMSDEDGRYSSDDGGYYSNRNFGTQNDDRGSHRAPYRSSEQNYEANSRWDNDRYGESRWNRPEEGDRNERNRRNERSERSERNERPGREERGTRWGREDFGWGGQMRGRDQEMGYNTDMTDEDNYGDFEGMSGGRSTRYADVDDVEGQYDEDYRDRDRYSHSRRSSNARSSYGSRR